MFPDFSRKSLIRSQRFLAKSPETSIPSFFEGHIRILRRISDLSIFFWMIISIWRSIRRKVRNSEIGLLAESPKTSSPSIFFDRFGFYAKFRTCKNFFGWSINIWRSKYGLFAEIGLLLKVRKHQAHHDFFDIFGFYAKFRTRQYFFGGQSIFGGPFRRICLFCEFRSYKNMFFWIRARYIRVNSETRQYALKKFIFSFVMINGFGKTPQPLLLLSIWRS